MSFLKKVCYCQPLLLQRSCISKIHYSKSVLQSSPSLQFYQNKIIEEYALQPVNPSTLRQFIFFGRQMNEERLITSANWVRKELLIRLAHRIRDFQQLPFIVGANPHIEYVYKHYLESFESIRHFPPVVTEADNLKFCKLLKNLLEDGLLALPKLAQGLCESAKFYSADQDNLDLFLNRTLRSRISRRVLAEQHLTLTKACEDQWGHGDGYVGIIFVHCSAQQMIKRVKGLVYQHIQTYHKKETNSQKLLPPEIEVTIHPNGQDNEFVFAYVSYC